MRVSSSSAPLIKAGLVVLLALVAGCSEPPVTMLRPTAAMPCPQWVLFPADRHSNTDSPYLGCTNEVNLRAMVANPADLERGRPLGLADGAHEARAVDAYRLGTAKTLGASGVMTPGANGAMTPGAGAPGGQ